MERGASGAGTAAPICNALRRFCARGEAEQGCPAKRRADAGSYRSAGFPREDKEPHIVYLYLYNISTLKCPSS